MEGGSGCTAKEGCDRRGRKWGEGGGLVKREGERAKERVSLDIQFTHTLLGAVHISVQTNINKQTNNNKRGTKASMQRASRKLNLKHLKEVSMATKLLGKHASQRAAGHIQCRVVCVSVCARLCVGERHSLFPVKAGVEVCSRSGLKERDSADAISLVSPDFTCLQRESTGGGSKEHSG